MLIKLMKGETGIELIMFYGSKTQWGLCLFARVFFSQLAEWLTLPDRAHSADQDRYEAWEETPVGVLLFGVSELSLCTDITQPFNIFIIICIIFSHVVYFFPPWFNQNILLLMLFPTKTLDYIKVAVLLVKASNKLMSGCCRLINISWFVFCLYAKKSLHIFFSSSLKIAKSLLLDSNMVHLTYLVSCSAREPPPHTEGQMLIKWAISEPCWECQALHISFKLNWQTVCLFVTLLIVIHATLHPPLFLH